MTSEADSSCLREKDLGEYWFKGCALADLVMHVSRGLVLHSRWVVLSARDSNKYIKELWSTSCKVIAGKLVR